MTYNPEGGILFTTDGANLDSLILLPHLDTGLSPWSQVTWGTDKKTRWEGVITVGAAITNSVIWAGLKLTNPHTVASDHDQIYFRYQNAVGGGVWQVVSSRTNVDTVTSTNVTVAPSTKYKLKIEIDADRIAKCYINGVLVVTAAALVTEIDLIPYIGVAAVGAAEAKTLTIHGQAISRDAG